MSIVAIILMGLTICAFIWNNDVQNIICYMGTILILVYGLICLFLYERNSITGKSMRINVIVLCLLEVMGNSFLINDNSKADIRVFPNIAASEWEDDYKAIKLQVGESPNL